MALLHGRMKADEKESRDARASPPDALHILVATTVVEVGVDVPNATVMIVEHAERFGLSQLHQLRGRVGRGAHESVCVLLYQSPWSEEARERLKAMAETNDGFVIAERDLELRGPGDFFGTRQHGHAAAAHRRSHARRRSCWSRRVHEARARVDGAARCGETAARHYVRRRSGSGNSALDHAIGLILMRIIAGEFKGRRLNAPTWDGLRPTSDKLRETLFNVLAPRVAGARVLDVFAGTGAIGLESLSRGAAHGRVHRARSRARRRSSSRTSSSAACANAVLSSATRPNACCRMPIAGEPFDLVMLDPPYELRAARPR